MSDPKMPPPRFTGSDDEFVALVLRYLDGLATSEDAALLKAELTASEARRKLVVSLGRLHGALGELLSADRQKAVMAEALPASARNGMRRAPRRSLSRRPLRGPSSPALIMAVTAAVVLFGIAVLLSLSSSESPPPPAETEDIVAQPRSLPAPPPARPPEEAKPPTRPAARSLPVPSSPESARPSVTSDPPARDVPAPKPPAPPPEPVPPPRERSAVTVATLTEVRGEVFTISQGKKTPARDQTPIASGLGIETAGSASAVLTWTDGTRVIVRAATLLAEIADRNGKSVRIDRGSVLADVAKQPADRPMVFQTPQGRARVLGTRLQLDVDPKRTTLEVEEGRVRLVRAVDGRSVEVRAGYAAVAAPGVRLAAKRLAPVLFGDAFDAAPPGQWPRGWTKHPTDPANRSGFVVVRDPARPNNRYITCQNPPGATQHAYFPFTDWREEFTITFRMRLSGGSTRRAGLELDDGRLRPTFELDAQAGSYRASWRAGEAPQITPFKPAPGAWSRWEVRVFRTRIAVKIDGREMGELERPDFNRVIAANLVSQGADSAQFDDVKVLRAIGARR